MQSAQQLVFKSNRHRVVLRLLSLPRGVSFVHLQLAAVQVVVVLNQVRVKKKKKRKQALNKITNQKTKLTIFSRKKKKKQAGAELCQAQVRLSQLLTCLKLSQLSFWLSTTSTGFLGQLFLSNELNATQMNLNATKMN